MAKNGKQHRMTTLAKDGKELRDDINKSGHVYLARVRSRNQQKFPCFSHPASEKKTRLNRWWKMASGSAISKLGPPAEVGKFFQCSFKTFRLPLSTFHCCCTIWANSAEIAARRKMDLKWMMMALWRRMFLFSNSMRIFESTPWLVVDRIWPRAARRWQG